MGWTTRHTYVDGEVITHTLLNVDVRDNGTWMATSHNHQSAGASAGSPALGTLDSIAFKDQASVPGAGTLQRNGTILMFGTAAIGGIAAPATASLRTLGSANGTQAANGTHTHTLSNPLTITDTTQSSVSENFEAFRGGNLSVPYTATCTATAMFYFHHTFIPSQVNGTYLLIFNGTNLFSGSANGGTARVNTTSIILPEGTYPGTLRNVGGTLAQLLTVEVFNVGTPQ